MRRAVAMWRGLRKIPNQSCTITDHHGRPIMPVQHGGLDFGVKNALQNFGSRDHDTQLARRLVGHVVFLQMQVACLAPWLI